LRVGAAQGSGYGLFGDILVDIVGSVIAGYAATDTSQSHFTIPVRLAATAW
jgi:uncharacterized membrane protein YeaQ/YmgE (transglycosylase-associated protein family)